MAEKGWKYTTIGIFTGVAVSVPKEGLFMKRIPAHKFTSAGKEIKVPDQWKNGMAVVAANKIGTKIINRHFFEVNSLDLGQKITATVEIVEKASFDGKEKYLMLNITKTQGPRTADIRYAPDGDGTLVPGTETRISIIPRQPREKMQMAS